jgi:hypothetical protein
MARHEIAVGSEADRAEAAYPKTFTAPDGTLMVQKTDDEGTPLPGQWVPKKYRPDQEAVAQEPAPKKQNPKIVVGGREWVR